MTLRQLIIVSRDISCKWLAFKAAYLWSHSLQTIYITMTIVLSLLLRCHMIDLKTSHCYHC